MFAKKYRPSISSLDTHSNIEDDDEMYLRKRHIRDQSPIIDRLDNDELSDALSEEEDIPGCPLPSTPEDNQLLEAEVRKIIVKFRIMNFFFHVKFHFGN